jgi:hypothetical protein
MKFLRKKDEDSRPINLVLLAVSFIIFGALGIVFITQMELHPGWAWEEYRDRYPMEIHTLETEDLNGNGINEIIGYADIRGTDDPERYENIQYGAIYCLEGANGKKIWSREFNGDGKKDFLVSGDDRVVALSTSKPMGLWLSPLFPLGMPLFIILTILLAAGVIIIILRGKRLSYKRLAIKEHKLTIVVNVLAIVLMTMTFILFLVLMNIFNNTLIAGTNNTNIIVAFLVVIITWYGIFPNCCLV